MIRAALLGAVLVHPISFLVAFSMGMAFGANPNFGGGPGTAPAFGLRGGLVGVESLLFGHLITMGLLPLGISVAGAGSGVVILLLVRIRVPTRQNSRVAWGAAGALLGASAGTAVATFVPIDGEWMIATSAGVVGAVVGGLLLRMGGWLPRTLGGGLGGVAGGCCVQAAPGLGQLAVSAVACGLVAVLVAAVVGESGKRLAAEQADPENVIEAR